MVDCYDDEEAFWGVFSSLDDSLGFPLSAHALGEAVTVTSLDGSKSGLRRGVMAQVRKGQRFYTLSLTSLKFTDPDPVSAKWLAVYAYWLGL